MQARHRRGSDYEILDFLGKLARGSRGTRAKMQTSPALTERAGADSVLRYWGGAFGFGRGDSFGHQPWRDGPSVCDFPFLTRYRGGNR
jgi:hypothetical protein